MADLETTIFRGHVVDIVRDSNGKALLESFPKGELEVSADGKVLYRGHARQSKNSAQKLNNYRDAFILPAFSDIHLHFPQMDMIGSYGEDLLGWLEKYTFPNELKYSDKNFAKLAAKRFVDELIIAGTTSACIFSSSHFDATEYLFDECHRRGVRAVVGQVLMDRHAPMELLTRDLVQVEKDFLTLASKWHGVDGRIKIAITPRFAPSCSDELLKLSGEFLKVYKDAFVQTHFAETKAEIDWVKELFPKHQDYLAVYEDFGLIGPQTILAHAVHLTESEKVRLSKAKVSVAHSPSSNMFLGSGVMSWSSLESADIQFGLSTDVGAGTSFSHWRTMGDAYKSQRLVGHSVTPAELLAKATIDGAKILFPEYKQFGFAKGARADFQVVDVYSSRLMTDRLERGGSIEEILFSLIWHWEPSMTKNVYVDGSAV